MKGSPYLFLSSSFFSPRVSLQTTAQQVRLSQTLFSKARWRLIRVTDRSDLEPRLSDAERCFVDNDANRDATAEPTRSINSFALFLPVIARSFVQSRERSDTHDRGGGYGLPGKLRKRLAPRTINDEPTVGEEIYNDNMTLHTPTLAYYKECNFNRKDEKQCVHLFQK